MAEDTATETKAQKTNATPRAALTACSVEKCKQPLRAKGYCRKHYFAWRRGNIGTHHRYKICAKEGCRKPRTTAKLCAEHSAKPDAK